MVSTTPEPAVLSVRIFGQATAHEGSAGRKRSLVALAMMLCAVAFSGCGAQSTSKTSAGGGVTPPTVSMDNPLNAARETDDRAGRAERTSGSGGSGDAVADLLDKIHAARAASFPSDPEQAQAVRRQRNLDNVRMATDVLRLTVNDPTRAAQFREGISQLLDARFQLALNGTEEDVAQLYADVQALNDRDPQSEFAADGIFCLARFAHTKARLSGQENAVWFENFSRWSREFAERFSDQKDRAVALLFGAARSCELHAVSSAETNSSDRLMTEAKLCYALLAEKFPETAQGADAVAVLRRLALPGTVLQQFAGPTADGGYLNSDQFRDRPTVICFWDGVTTDFQARMKPAILESAARFGDRLRIVSISLDEGHGSTENSVNPLPGEQIVFPSEDQKGWKHPLVRFWGISHSPSAWLIDADGRVVSVDVRAEELAASIERLIDATP
ncbi:MAG: hypothetical protein R3C49_14240 [Planctomycetaceae bacterium]